MASTVASQERCPNCGRHEITADRHYASKRKRNDFLRRVFGNPLAWIAVAFAIADILLVTDVPVVLRYPLAIAAFAVVIMSVVRTSRAVYGADATGRYPDSRYTCRVCGHQWTSAGSRTVAADEDDQTGTGPVNGQRIRPSPAAGKSGFDWGGCLGIAVPVAVGLALLAALLIAVLISRSS